MNINLEAYTNSNYTLQLNDDNNKSDQNNKHDNEKNDQVNENNNHVIFLKENDIIVENVVHTTSIDESKQHIIGENITEINSVKNNYISENNLQENLTHHLFTFNDEDNNFNEENKEFINMNQTRNIIGNMTDSLYKLIDNINNLMSDIENFQTQLQYYEPNYDLKENNNESNNNLEENNTIDDFIKENIDTLYQNDNKNNNKKDDQTKCAMSTDEKELINNGDCVICIEPMYTTKSNNSYNSSTESNNTNQPEQIEYLQCLHKFHKHCIDYWKKNKQNCPICKFPTDIYIDSVDVNGRYITNRGIPVDELTYNDDNNEQIEPIIQLMILMLCIQNEF
jgi:hypothetical protein